MTVYQTDPDGILLVPAATLVEDAAARFAELREMVPVIRTEQMSITAIRYDDIRELTASPALIQVPGANYAQFLGLPPGRTANFLSSLLLMSNGEEHARRRGAFARTFAHPVIRGRRSQIRAVADAIAADLPRGKPFDFHALFSSRLPSEVIASILGLDAADSGWFAGHVYSLSRTLSPPFDPSAFPEIEASAEALFGFLAEAIRTRRNAPREDLLSTLATDESARALEADELVYQLMAVVLAGSDTTRAAATITVGLLLEDRRRWDEVAADRSLIPAAIDEALRIEPPVASLPRFVVAPVEIGGTAVAPNQILALNTLSAMNDPVRFANPETFDLHRPDQIRPHLVFGAGPHRCLGEMLARIELEESLAALMDAAPGIEMLEPPHVTGYGGIRRTTPLIARI